MSVAPTSSLAGKRIVNTRAAHQAAEFSALLRARGANPLEYPCITIAPPEDSAPLDAALAALATGRFDWLILTSANTVAAIAQRLETLSVRLPPLGVACAAVGPATARAAGALLGLDVTHIPEHFAAVDLAHSLPVQSGDRLLLPVSAIARPTLADSLLERGVQLTVVAAYTTRCAAAGGADLPALCAQGQVDALTFTSPSTISCFLRRYRAEGGDEGHLRALVVACIGAATAESARTSGLAVHVLPVSSTLDGLVVALEEQFAARPAAPQESA